jgi:hypothetical protein
MPTLSASTRLAGDRVEVYWNLHKDCFSVRALSGPQKGRVVAHVQDIDLSDVTFSVQHSGRNKVLATKRKNVHAFVRGIVCAGPPLTAITEEVTYNPYKHAAFVRKGDGAAVHRANVVQARTTEKGRARLAMA